MSEAAILIAVGVIGLGIGIWLGLPGRYSQSLDDIENVMDAGGRERKKHKRLSPMAWLRRGSSKGPTRSKRGRKGFKLEAPDDR